MRDWAQCVAPSPDECLLFSHGPLVLHGTCEEIRARGGATIGQGEPALVEARRIVNDFYAMLVDSGMMAAGPSRLLPSPDSS